MEAGNISIGQVVPGVEEMVEWGWVARNPPVLVQIVVEIPVFTGRMEAGNISRGQVVPGVEEMVECGWVARNPPVVVQMVIKVGVYR